MTENTDDVSLDFDCLIQDDSYFVYDAIFALKWLGGLVTGFSNIDYFRTGHQQQMPEGSGYWLLQY